MFDLFFWPFPNTNPIFGLGVVSCLTGLLMVLVFRYTSNQKALRRAKDRVQAHLLEVRLFQDQLGVVLHAYGRILRWTLAYLRQTLVPLAVLIVPLAVILIQLDLRLGQAAPRPGEPFLLKARLVDPAASEQASLRLPRGLTLSAPPLHIPDQAEVDWRLQAERSGEFVAEVVVGGQALSKRITLTDKVVVLPAKRVRSALLERLFDPEEAPLPEAGPLESIEVGYRGRTIDLKFFQAHWIWPFLVISLLAGFALKGVLRAEF